MPVTLKDIAARVGKSVPTVSRALGGHADISPHTRRHVQRVAQEMGYEPSVTARNLQRRRTDTIALILPSLRYLRPADPFFGEFISGIVEKTAEDDFDLNIATDSAGDARTTYLKHIRSRRADGYIVVRTRCQDERIDILREHGVPFVAYGRTNRDNDFHLVDEDGAGGILQAVAHLVKLGHERIGCISEPLYLTKSHHRVQGYWQGLAAHGIARRQEFFVEASFRQRSGEDAAHRLLGLANPPTAIIACNDLLALGIMNAVRKQNMVVGRDVSVTGFDDIVLAGFANPALTTIRLPAWEIGRMTAELLVRLITGREIAQRQVIVEPELVVRASTGALLRTAVQRDGRQVA